MREKTIAYFLAEITKSYGNGDCILLENIDENGNVIHALIDTGRKINGGVVCKFLEKHKVKKLVFLCITHSHGDHNGDTISVLDNYKVDLLIMKEYDHHWCADGTQKTYENILAKAIEKNVKVLGVSFESLGSKEYSPSQSEDFIAVAKTAKKENFIYFNEKNVIFEFGSADIKIMNWQIFDSEGNLFITGKNNKDGKKVYRDIYPWENENSLGILLIQGDKKAFFSGDMNNLVKNVGGIKIGDEDRLKNEIGKIDLLKLGHHGYQNSNTTDYINILLPNYAVITNDVGREYIETTNFLLNNKVNYLYTTQDEYEICASIYNDEVTLGFGTSGIKKVKEELFYIPEDKIYSNYLTCKYPVKYEIEEKSVKNWDELKKMIEENQKNGKFDDTEKCFKTKSLKISLNKGDTNVYIANSSISINHFQKIQLISNDEITIKRDKSLTKLPLFKAENGIFILGEENMKGKIILDGDKKNVASTSHLIQLISSEFTMYNNVTLCNNLFKISKRTKDLKEFGSALFAVGNSIINIYGGDISNNVNEVYIPKDDKASTLPETMETTYAYDSRGAGIYINTSILNMYDGKIYNNEGINNSDIYSNQNGTNYNSPKSVNLYQRCLGTGIFGDNKCSINLYKGEISNNKAINNAKTNFITPKDSKKSNLNSLYDCIYGSALYLNNSEFEMKKDFIIQNNSSVLNSTINVQKNCLINSLHSAIRGGQIYLGKDKIKIQGGTIQNSSNSSKVNSNIVPDEEGKVKTISSDLIGGGINIVNCSEFQISNLKVNKCNAKNGGALYFSNSAGKISNSELNNNKAQSFGGAIFLNSSCQIELYNSKVLNNSTQEGSGGGIYAQGYLILSGKNNSVSQNTAGTYGGGIIFKSKGLIRYCTIYKNKALKNCGGGIRNDGDLGLEDGKIYGNWCQEYGGGIHNAKKLSYDKNKISSIVYDNTAVKGGNNLYPEK